MRVPGLAVAALGVLAILTVSRTAAAPSAELTFPQRLAAERAVLRVYASHQSPTVPLDRAVPDAVVEMKVRQALKRSVALESFWGVRIDAVMLRREIERMRRDSRMPARLRELEVALGDDSVLIQETLARPALAARLARHFFEEDRVIHAPARHAIDALRARLLEGSIDYRAARAGRSAYRLTRRVDAAERGPEGAARSARGVDEPSLVELDDDALERWSGELPAGTGRPGPVQETADAFLVYVPLARGRDRIDVARYAVPKLSWDEWWNRVAPGLDESGVTTVAQPIEGPPRVAGPDCGTDNWNTFPARMAPDARYDHAAVWTGTEMIVWGGYDIALDRLNTGGRYDPAVDTWTPTSVVNAPQARSLPLAVWTGTRMLIWGGANRILLGTGGSYDPGTDSWTPLSTVLAPAPRTSATAVWTGSRMIVWGGSTSAGSTNLGAAYDPVGDSWTVLSDINAPNARRDHTAVWTGTRMVVWGGIGTQGVSVAHGGRYDPLTDTWTPTTLTLAPAARSAHTAVWTGSKMIVWGGIGTINPMNSGGLYDPVLDSWSVMLGANPPAARSGHSAVWTGTEMVVWGGGAASLISGGRYNPVSDSWIPTSTVNSPIGRAHHSTVWTGSLMIVWGGSNGQSFEPSLNSGGRYDPVSNSWTPTFTGDVPYSRFSHSLVWTGSLLVAWGGAYAGGALSADLATGGRYDPALDQWEPTTLAGAPSARSDHSTVWTGTRLVVWGGISSHNYTNTGAQYDPLGDAWTPTSLVSAPPGRNGNSVVWTGQWMIIWGGYAQGTAVNTGARYNPSLDLWTPMSATGAPTPRATPAVWTGTRMIVWSGAGSGDSSGGRYDLSTDSWTSMSMVQAPLWRAGHTVVWTGSRMIVWGGRNITTLLNDGGIYDPATNSWSGLSSVGAPSARDEHTAVWTGSEMLIHGGTTCTSWCFATPGGRYRPDTNAWSPMSTDGGPPGGAPAVWADTRMFLWGVSGSFLLGGLGYTYCDCAQQVWYQDLDGDGLGSSLIMQSCTQPPGYVATGGDCDDGAPGAWQPPGEAIDLSWIDAGALTADTLTWSPPALQGGTTLTYDLLRSTNRADFGATAVCAATDVSGTTVTDGEAPAPGGIYYYLVRAVNGCPGPSGDGSLGSASNGTPRPGRTCP